MYLVREYLEETPWVVERLSQHYLKIAVLHTYRPLLHYLCVSGK